MERFLQLCETFAPQPGREPGDVAIAIAAQILKDAGIDEVVDAAPKQGLGRLQRYGICVVNAQSPWDRPLQSNEEVAR